MLAHPLATGSPSKHYFNSKTINIFYINSEGAVGLFILLGTTKSQPINLILNYQKYFLFVKEQFLANTNFLTPIIFCVASSHSSIQKESDGQLVIWIEE